MNWNEARKILGQKVGGRALVDALPKKKGWLEITQRRQGRVIDYEIIKNVICNAGLGQVSGYVNGAIAGKNFGYMAIGIGTVAAAATDTVLGSEITTGGGARAAATVGQTTTTVTNDTATWTHTWTFTASFAVTEEGLLDAATAGNLLAHQVFGAYNVVSGDSLQVNHNVQD